MAEQSALVLIQGKPSQLPPGDSLTGVATGDLVVSSGLISTGSLPFGEQVVDISLAVNASGLIFAGDTIGLDGKDLVLAQTALISGTDALALAAIALASGTQAQQEAEIALASGNAALEAFKNFESRVIFNFTAASTVASGTPVGLDDTGGVQTVRVLGSSITPTYNSQPNFIGIAQTAAASGNVVSVLLPKSIDYSFSSLSPGVFYYLNPSISGLTDTSTKPTLWSTTVDWAPVGKAISSSGLLLLNTL
jgi:hypothetical protein